MLTGNGILDRGWSYAITILTGVLAVVTLSAGDNVFAAQKETGTFQDKTEALRKSGYVELSGDDAVRFLIGNSVVIKPTDAPKGFPTPEYDRRYYFSDARTAYECAGNDCSSSRKTFHARYSAMRATSSISNSLPASGNSALRGAAPAFGLDPEQPAARGDVAPFGRPVQRRGGLRIIGLGSLGPLSL
jgi:hypothetical protein